MNFLKWEEHKLEIENKGALPEECYILGVDLGFNEEYPPSGYKVGFEPSRFDRMVL